MRAEALRSMSFRHPINALITHHTYMDTGLFYLALGGVTSQGTGWDVVSGLGATGSTVFASDYLKNFTFGLDFEDDVRKRGLDELPNQKYVKYGRLLNKAIGSFTTGYVNAWYASDDDVLADGELQQWAAACAVLLKTNGFPAAFKKKNTLAKMLKSIIFSSTVAHHAMNHFAVWHSVAFPFSLPGIFKKLPSVKGQPVNVMDYVIPGSSVPLFMHQIIIYNMPTPPSFNLFNAYSGEAFSSCTKLSSVIAKWKSDLKTIEDVITNAEKNEASPYRILLPSDLTFDSLV
jgi:hypothetical protein